MSLVSVPIYISFPSRARTLSAWSAGPGDSITADDLQYLDTAGHCLGRTQDPNHLSFDLQRRITRGFETHSSRVAGHRSVALSEYGYFHHKHRLWINVGF